MKLLKHFVDQKGETWMNDPPCKWDNLFLDMAGRIASMSKDPSTKAGAIIVRPDKSVCSMGFNGFAKGFSDAPELYADREVKYSRVIHAEMNALLFARETVRGYTLYTTAPCCHRCFVHMVQAGITKFVCKDVDAATKERWGVDKTISFANEAGVEVVMYTG